MRNPLKALARFLGLEELRELDTRTDANLCEAKRCLRRAQELNYENRGYLIRAQKYYEDTRRMLEQARKEAPDEVEQGNATSPNPEST